MKSEKGLVRFVLASGNQKTGPIPVSTTDESTCPDVCPLKGKGCYARFGPLGMVWRGVQKWGMPWGEFCKKVAALPRNTLWRHNQAGDLPGDNNLIDRLMLRALVLANRNRRGFTYTHKPMDRASNRQAVLEANQNGFTINLSADNLGEADRLHALGIAPIVTILPRDLTGDVSKTYTTPQGRKVVVCPATYKENVTCQSCGLCQRNDRSCIIGFPAHGAAVRMADMTAKSFA